MKWREWYERLFKKKEQPPSIEVYKARYSYLRLDTHSRMSIEVPANARPPASPGDEWVHYCTTYFLEGTYPGE